jgi:nickel-dependent lactate racemase
MDVPVLLNRAVVEHDVALVVGPVLPHEVVGMSGGNKYFFPGVAGQAIIDVSHWLGALITSAEIIGTTGITPVRALINEGAALVPARKLAFCVVGASGSLDLHSVSFGDTLAAWANAAEVCAATTSRTSTSRSVASSRSSRRCTRTSGREPRASASSSRRSRTVAR